MKHLKESPGPHNWPRKAYPSVECRKRDLVIRISDWSRDRDEPAFDVECYVGGVYDFHQSETFAFRQISGLKRPRNRAEAKAQAIAFAQQQIAALL